MRNRKVPRQSKSTCPPYCAKRWRQIKKKKLFRAVQNQ